MSEQYAMFKDCLARRILARSTPSEDTDGDALDDFSEYLASELWPVMPQELHTCTYDSQVPATLIEKFDDPDSDALSNLPTSISDSLVSFGIAADWDAARVLALAAIRDYVTMASAPPPAWSSTRASECELCDRTVPLTYHHLIPRSTHVKVKKKGWHPESMLNSVAWLCRPCHSAVHHVASNEELAKNYYTLDLLLEREDIQRWRKYAAKQRWGVKRG
ncbi:hypothetical protein PENSPDRAFT_573500 [Peniophora sp. CONT]|nr:hypothetical protein PENSPDRAFT_573500 [Peniophora sp. CONT]